MISKATIEDIIGPVNWFEEFQGYCECPGKALHTTKDGARDCIVYLEPIPTIYCVHQSCTQVVADVNHQIRGAARRKGGSGGQQNRNRKTYAANLDRLGRHERIRRRARSSLTRLLREHHWPYSKILADSPVPPPQNVADHWKVLIGGFPTDVAIWVGDTYESGKPVHMANFRTKAGWLNGPGPAGPYVCPAGFRPGSFSRSNENVAQRIFLVVESDLLSRDEVGAVFHWLTHAGGLSLRFVVDTGGKSLHAWFDYPNDKAIEELKLMLPELKCDPKMFTASQPARLPGVPRGDRFQRLIYCGEEVSP